ncbi:MAG: class I SAM-dependent methyltransferase [Gemmataceae bacterium]
MQIEFTAHNIRLDDGTFTKPDMSTSMESHPWFVSARRVLETVFPGDKSRFRVLDLGCLEGGFAVEFARMGFQVLGIDVREINIAACQHVKANTNLPNLEFVRDDAWNMAKYGTFDAAFCCGLLYHLDRPKQFLKTLSSITSKLLILQTHFSSASDDTTDQPRTPEESSVSKYCLSPIVENESLLGRWYNEFATEALFQDREKSRWASWDNRNSFWVQREYLLQAIQDVGFDLVMEQFDCFGTKIVEAMVNGAYKTEARGTFIGVKTR